MRAAVIQISSGTDRAGNVERALALVDRAARLGARLVVLPEYMTYLGRFEGLAAVAETVPGPTSVRLAAKAREHGIYLHGGSLIERSPRPDRFYNTSLLYGPEGQLLATYRKIHLFDVDVPGQVTVRESQAFLPGDTLAIAPAGDLQLGLSICFDLRFPELYRALAIRGAEVLLVPAAFAQATGRVHWEILLRARAIENHAYVLAAAQYGQDAAGRGYYGHSLIVDPWGAVLGELPDGEGILLADLDPEQVRQRRQQVPVLELRRPAAYE